MTVEEKRQAIERHCHQHFCEECQLYRNATHCHSRATENEINENYERLFGGSKMTDISSDKVDHPSHYNQGDIECIDAMVAAYGTEAVEIFCLLNAFKYLWRAEHKNGKEDLEKALWYLKKRLELMDSDQSKAV